MTPQAPEIVQRSRPAGAYIVHFQGKISKITTFGGFPRRRWEHWFSEELAKSGLGESTEPGCPHSSENRLEWTTAQRPEFLKVSFRRNNPWRL